MKQTNKQAGSILYFSLVFLFPLGFCFSLSFVQAEGMHCQGAIVSQEFGVVFGTSDVIQAVCESFERVQRF